jgi:hypothetical protein
MKEEREEGKKGRRKEGREERKTGNIEDLLSHLNYLAFGSRRPERLSFDLPNPVIFVKLLGAPMHHKG